MPCLPGERFLLLERSVAVGQAGSKEVDALVAKLGEVLQLSAQRAPAPRGPKHPQPASARGRVAPYAPRGSDLLAPAPLQPHQPVESQRPGKASQRVAKQLCGRGWLRSATRRRKRPGPGEAAGEEEDPHRLLEQLILSGNLIKEAVRRLQLAAAAVATATTGGSGEGEAAALQPLQ